MHKMNVRNQNPSRIAIVLTHVEYIDIPFGHLWQQDKTNLVNIYILLSEKEMISKPRVCK